MHDPFLDEWEHIYAYVRVRPLASAGEILREWQRRFPERFVEVHLSLLQRCLRIEREWFERFLDACYASQTKQATMAYAAVRNRAILWVLWDTGLLVSEMCALNLGDVDQAQGTLHVQRKGSKGRVLPLTPEVQQALAVYLEQHRLRAEKCGASDPLFLSEQRGRLTKNGITQLFHRLCNRAGLEDRRLTPTMLREAFALRLLQTGGLPKTLQQLLGLAEGTPIKRHPDTA